MAIRNIIAALLICGVALGCATDSGGMSKTKKGALLGALAGAAAGAAIGGHKNRAAGVLIGAAAGAAAGGLIGRYLDDQAKELDAIPGAEVERRDDSLLVHFSDAILFETGKSNLMPGAYDRLRSVARTLNNYPESQVIIKGHTDNVGPEAFNQRLSEERAERVRNFMIAEAVRPSRVTAIGFGESLPITTNATSEGRATNRRVEIEIRPHEEVFESSGS